MLEYTKNYPLPDAWDKEYVEKAKLSVSRYVIDVQGQCRTQKELMHKVMGFFKGHISPHLAIEVIKEQTNLP